jgi:hypothetical protein
MNNFHSRSGIHIEIQNLNIEAAQLSVTIKTNFEELWYEVGETENW